MIETNARNYLDRFHEAVAGFYEMLLHGTYTCHRPRRTQGALPDPKMPYHSLPEFFIQLQGTSCFRCPGSRFDLRPGEACVIPTGVPHGETIRYDDADGFAAVVVFIKDARLVFLASNGEDRGVPQVEFASSFGSPDAVAALSYLEALAATDPNRSARHRIRADALLRVFLSLVLEILESENPAPRANETRAYQAQNLINERLADPDLSIAAMAEALACCPDHLTRIFQQHFGQTPNRYIRSERLRLAVALMHDGRFNLSEIARQAGFRSLNYFSRVFAQRMGYPPSEYKLRRN